MKKLLVFLDPRQLRRLEWVIGATLVASVIEMAGIGTIPAFVSLVVEPGRLLAALPDGPFKVWVDRLDQSGRVLYGAGVLASLFVVKNCLLSALNYAETRLIQDVTAAVSNRLFRSYLACPYAVHLQRNPAELIRNLTDEVIYAVDFLKGGMRLVREGLVLTVIVTLMMLVDPVVSLSVLALLGVASGGFYLLVRGKLTRYGQRCHDHWALQIQIINQSLGVLKEAKLLGRESYLMELFQRETRGLASSETVYGVIGGLPRYFLEALTVSAVLPLSIAFVALGRPIQSMLPMLALFGVAAMRLVPAVTALNSAVVDIRYKRPTFDLICTELETMESDRPQRSHSAGQTESTQRMQKQLSLDEVHYRYPGASTDALHRLSLTVEVGQAVAIIGASGAGKSTLVNVMLGLLMPTAGVVRVDGCDIHARLPEWQRQIGYVPQEVYLTDDSIRRNIAFGLPDDSIDEVAVMRALQAAQIDGFVRSLPGGLGTSVGDRGIRLSAGQRQRLGIARALYHNPSVLVMDEATSALDHKTERDVMDAVGKLRGQRTLIVITHRLRTVMQYDRLYLLNAGRFDDHGTFDQLLKRHPHLREAMSAASERELESA